MSIDQTELEEWLAILPRKPAEKQATIIDLLLWAHEDWMTLEDARICVEGLRHLNVENIPQLPVLVRTRMNKNKYRVITVEEFLQRIDPESPGFVSMVTYVMQDGTVVRRRARNKKEKGNHVAVAREANPHERYTQKTPGVRGLDPGDVSGGSREHTGQAGDDSTVEVDSDGAVGGGE